MNTVEPEQLPEKTSDIIEDEELKLFERDIKLKQAREKRINKEIDDIVEEIWTKKHEILPNLFKNIPTDWTIKIENGFVNLGKIVKKIKTDNGKEYAPKDLRLYLESLPNEYRKYALAECKNKLRHAIKEEIYDKQIPLEVFLIGTLSYGFCEKIAYHGQYYLSMCDLRARILGLESIEWGRTKIMYHIRDIDRIEQDMTSIKDDPDNIKHVTFLPTTLIINYKGKKDMIMWNRQQNPYVITAATITYLDREATWVLDCPSLKFKKEWNSEVKTLVSQYAERPISMAQIKAMKALAKKIYAGKMDIYDADEDDIQMIRPDDMVESTADIKKSEEMATILNAKESIAADKLAFLKNMDS